MNDRSFILPQFAREHFRSRGLDLYSHPKERVRAESSDRGLASVRDRGKSSELAVGPTEFDWSALNLNSFSAEFIWLDRSN